MENKNQNTVEPAPKKFRFSFLQVMGIVALVMIVTAFLTAWWVKHYIYASKFTPTVLTAKEQKVLNSKLVMLEESTKKDPVVPKKGGMRRGLLLNRKPILKKVQSGRSVSRKRN